MIALFNRQDDLIVEGVILAQCVSREAQDVHGMSHHHRTGSVLSCGLLERSYGFSLFPSPPPVPLHYLSMLSPGCADQRQSSTRCGEGAFGKGPNQGCGPPFQAANLHQSNCCSISSLLLTVCTIAGLGCKLSKIASNSASPFDEPIVQGCSKQPSCFLLLVLLHPARHSIACYRWQPHV